MKKQIIGIFDRKADSFQEVATVPSLGLAHRMFTEAVNTQREGSAIYKYPEDFALYHLGEVDDNTGVITPVEKQMLAQGDNVKVRS